MECPIAATGKWSLVSRSGPCPGATHECGAFALANGILWSCPGGSFWIHRPAGSKLDLDPTCLDVTHMTDKEWEQLTYAARPHSENT
jgi:hypothetical protein